MSTQSLLIYTIGVKIVQQIRDSIYNPGFYTNITNQTIGSALRYFLLLILLLVLVQSLDALPALMNIQRRAPEWVESVVNYVPAKLVVTIKEGQVSTNVEEPYFIPLDPDTEATSSGQNILVIDTKTPFSNTQFEEYNAIAWLTKDTLFYQDKNGQGLKAYQLTQVKDLMIDRNLIRQLTNYLQPWYNLVTPILFVFTLIGLYILQVLNLFYLIILAALIWLLTKLLKKNLTYTQSYKVGLHAITLSLLVDLVITIAAKWIELPTVPFMFSIIALAVVVVNFKTRDASSTSR